MKTGQFDFYAVTVAEKKSNNKHVTTTLHWEKKTIPYLFDFLLALQFRSVERPTYRDGNDRCSEEESPRSLNRRQLHD